MDLIQDLGATTVGTDVVTKLDVVELIHKTWGRDDEPLELKEHPPFSLLNHYFKNLIRTPILGSRSTPY